MPSQVLCNVIKQREGLEEALSASLVETLIGLLAGGNASDVHREASATLAFACFDDTAKIIAIQVRQLGTQFSEIPRFESLSRHHVSTS